MPLLDPTEKNVMLDATDIATVSLHTAYSPVGDFEVVGGDPPYARQPVLFNPAVNAQKSMLSPPPFDVPADVTLLFLGLWDAIGNFKGMEPLGGDGLRPFTGVDPTGVLACPAHGFNIGDTLTVWGGSAAVLPTWLVEGTVYYVVATDPNMVQVSDSLGGTALGDGTFGSGFLQRIIPLSTTAQMTFPITSLTLDASAAG